MVAVGSTLEEAFYYIHNLVTACEIQVSHTELHAGIKDIQYYLYLYVWRGKKRWDLILSVFFSASFTYIHLYLSFCVSSYLHFVVICIFDPS